jgi:hypothetical protein
VNNILSVNNIPQSSKNLISVHHFTRENHVFLELHPWHFLIKDRATRRTLHHSKVEGGLYSLKSIKKQVCVATKTSHARWHNQLGHPSLQIMDRVLSQNKLPVSR